MDAGKDERSVDQYVKEGKTGEAVKLLFDLIVEAVEKNDFNKAESLRNRLLDIDALALTEIVKTGELIEQKKASAIDKGHLHTWSALYDQFSPEEKNLFYYATTPIRVSPGQFLLEQGKPNAYLYLIDDGVLHMSCNINGEDVLIKKLNKGCFAGDDTFLSVQAFCNVSVIAQTHSKARRLPRAAFREWRKTMQGLSTKLDEFILKSGPTHALINQMNIKRRAQKRIPLADIGQFQLFDPSGGKMGNPFKGSLLDISSGGMCFLIRVGKRETARMLVGRRLSARFHIQLEKREQRIDRTGLIISVHEYGLTDYSIHMRFDEDIEDLKETEGSQPA